MKNNYIVQGKNFDTFASLCRYYKIDDSKVRRRRGLGWTLEESLGIKSRLKKSSQNAKKNPFKVCLW